LLSEAGRHSRSSFADLVELTAARQGATKSGKLLAVDVACLHDPVRKFLKTWKFSEGPDVPSDHKSFANTLRRGVEARQEQLREWHQQTRTWLGQGYDKQATIEAVRDLLTDAKQQQLCTAEEIQRIRNLLTEFRDDPVSEALDTAERATNKPADGVTLAALAFDYSKTFRITRELGACTGQLFDNLERKIDSTLEDSGVAKVREVVERVRRELDTLQALVASYKGIYPQ
jgi:hypothetical protein